MIKSSYTIKPGLILSAAVILSLSLLAAPSALAQRRPRTTPPKEKAAPPPSPQQLKELNDTAAQSRAKLLEASQAYRESLAKVLALQTQEEERAAALLEKRRKLLELGVIAKREVEESEQALAEAQKKSAETRRQIEETEQLTAEVLAAEQLAKQPVVVAQAPTARSNSVKLIRYIGTGRWSLTGDFAKVDAFFRGRFARGLPISAFGQTETHNRLGFDHNNAFDVAVHPDSAEGQTLIAFLRAEGIPFIAMRSAIAGAATGAHIHIGPASHRLGLAP